MASAKNDKVRNNGRKGSTTNNTPGGLTRAPSLPSKPPVKLSKVPTTTPGHASKATGSSTSSTNATPIPSTPSSAWASIAARKLKSDRPKVSESASSPTGVASGHVDDSIQTSKRDEQTLGKHTTSTTTVNSNNTNHHHHNHNHHGHNHKKNHQQTTPGENNGEFTSVNQFNSKQIEEFLKARAAKFSDVPVFKQSGSDWSKSSNGKSKKEKDVVLLELAKALKHRSW